MRFSGAQTPMFTFKLTASKPFPLRNMVMSPKKISPDLSKAEPGHAEPWSLAPRNGSVDPCAKTICHKSTRLLNMLKTFRKTNKLKENRI